MSAHVCKLLEIFGGSIVFSSNLSKAQSSFPSLHLDAAHGPAAHNGGSVAAGAGTGIRGAGVVAEMGMDQNLAILGE